MEGNTDTRCATALQHRLLQHVLYQSPVLLSEVAIRVQSGASVRDLHVNLSALYSYVVRPLHAIVRIGNNVCGGDIS